MVYSSVVFIFYFLPLLLAVYYILPRTWTKNILLFLVSLLFYAWGAGKLVILLLAVGISAWLFSMLIAKTKFKKAFLIFAIITYIGALVYYKYLGFIINNLTYAGVGGLPVIKILTTIGVSFYIFQALSYNIDVYRRNKRFEKNPLYVILYLTMFPQLVSGPLVRYHQLEAQLKRRTFDFTRFAEGIRRFIIGLAKKALIANPLSILVVRITTTEHEFIGTKVAWAGTIAFALQLLFDFAGYTDMAIGVGKMLGFDLPENFNYPYISRSITDFWRRWHITLSAWLRDYLFMPLSLSLRRQGKAGVFIALFITFTICGIWHGATWNFIIWGAFQGLFLGLENLFLGKFLERIRGASIIYTLFILLTGFVFVMTPNLHDAFQYLSGMFSPGGSSALGLKAFLTNEDKVLLALGIIFCIPISLPKRFKTGKIAGIMEALSSVILIALFLLSVMAITTQNYNPFIYFRF